jgi:hypothetical protein
MPFPNRETMLKPGQSGNPAGRPRNLLGEALRSRLDGLAPDGRPMADHLAEALLQLALQGDIGAFKVILDRVDGKVVAASPIDPEPTTIQVIYLPDNGRGDGPESDPELS